MINENYDIDKVSTARTVAKALKLGQQQKALLELYAKYESGNELTEKVIVENADIAKERLVKNGLIKQVDDAIIIDWKTLSAVAFAYEHYPRAFKDN